MTEIKRNKDGQKMAVLECTLDELKAIRYSYIYALDNMDLKHELPEIYSLLTNSEIHAKTCIALKDLRTDIRA